jgi:AraC-like DNA-binding protein
MALSFGDFIAHHESLLCELLELIPVAIHLYKGNGISVFVNSAFKETFHIEDMSAVVGKFNLLADPFHNDTLNLREYIQRVFSGHPIFVENIKTPLEYVTDIFLVNRKHVQDEVMYQSIRGFPIPDAQGGVAYVVLMFELEKRYSFGQNIAAAKDAIEGQLTGKFDIDMAAQASSMSKTNLTRLFKKHFGMTPHDYWLDLKISKLMNELKSPSISISDAFASCGFDYNSYYTRLFKKKTGLTPMQYKNIERERVC